MKRPQWMRSSDVRTAAQLVAVGILVLVFVKIADSVSDQETDWFDHAILRAFRNAPDDPIGSPAIEAAVMHISALGSGVVAGIIVTIVSSYLLLIQRARYALTIITVAVGTGIVMNILKPLFERPRPTLVKQFDPPGGLSFPSGHSMISAALYITLGVMVARTQDHRRTRIFCVGMGALLALMIGTSRVYLGVHYPTDVIAGWTVGMTWALIVGLVTRRFAREVDAEPDDQESK